MQFSQLLAITHAQISAVVGDVQVSGITDDSRQVKPGDLFVCRSNGDAFLAASMGAGASAALVTKPESFAKAVQAGFEAVVEVEGGANELLRVTAKSCMHFAGDPTASMRVIGVTGTNGKTTTSWMIRDALQSMGRKAGYLGTLGYQGPGGNRELSNTTPFPVELCEIISSARDSGCQDLVMEVSSHGLVENRVAGVQFDIGLFTNLSQDHLDFHGSMDEYIAAKKLLFTEFARDSNKAFTAILNGDDPIVERWRAELLPLVGEKYKILTFGEQQCEFRAIPIKVTASEIELSISFDGRTETASLGIGGLFNVSNARACGAALIAMGHSVHEVAEALTHVRPVPGRFEAVPNASGIDIVVDYAHTPDALEKLLQSARDLRPRKVITVFGCGGDRDKSKRPLMGAVASELSDYCIVTSDNPRTEDPEAIISEILSGMKEHDNYKMVVDRSEAIQVAISSASPGDLVVIAGKGHENYQIIGKTKFPMDDRQLARDALGAKL